MLDGPNTQIEGARQFLSFMRGVNSQLFRAIDMRDSMALQAARVAVPDDDFLEHAVWMDVWDYSISRDAAWAMHDLALRTPQAILVNVWNLACELHSEPAVMCLLPRLKREVATDSMLMPLISCGETPCNQCKHLQAVVLTRFESVPIDASSFRCLLDDDFGAVRTAVVKAKQANVFTMQHPILATSAKTAVVYAAMRSRATRRWTMVAAVVVARVMWTRWMKRQLEPGSRYLKLVEARWRLKTLSLA